MGKINPERKEKIGAAELEILARLKRFNRPLKDIELSEYSPESLSRLVDRGYVGSSSQFDEHMRGHTYYELTPHGASEVAIILELIM